MHTSFFHAAVGSNIFDPPNIQHIVLNMWAKIAAYFFVGNRIIAFNQTKKCKQTLTKLLALNLMKMRSKPRAS
jgi:hypothetical protein